MKEGTMAFVSKSDLPKLDLTYEEDPRVVKQAATEDYSLHVVPLSWRGGKWSVAAAWSALASAMFWVIVAGTIALAVGTVNAIIGCVLSVIAYGAINGVLTKHAINTGTTVALFSRSLFGYMGAALAPLIFGATAIYYFVFEGSVIATVFQTYIGGNIKIWYLVVVLYSMPLVIGGVRVWLDKFNGFLLPFYIIGLFGAVVWAIVKYGYSGQWLNYHPKSMAGIMGPGWLFAFTAYIGVWIMMMYTWDFARFGKKKDVKFHSRFSFGSPFYLFTLLINGAIGIFLAHSIPISGGLSEVSAVLGLVSMMGIFAVILIWISQTRINTANLYLASTNLESFFSRVFKLRLRRLWWVLIAAIIGYVVMLTNIFSYILHALAWQGVFVTSWVGIALAVILNRRLHRAELKEGEPEFEFRPGRVPYFSPGIASWLVSSAVGLYFVEDGGRFGGTWGPIITFVIAFGVQYALVNSVAKKFWVMSRPNDPRDEVEDIWEARARCHVCDRSYIVYEMDRDPSADHKPICAGCASESMAFYRAASEEHRGSQGAPSSGLAADVK
jgi:purine-cytosine permease-like protein